MTNPITSPLPWQTLQWQQLVALAAQQRLPHALLFKGPRGTGKLLLAQTFAQWLLCLQPMPEGACLQCHSCKLLQADTHPDYQLLQSSDDQAIIKIDQIRDLIHFCSLSKQISQRKILIIACAEAMNSAAANAFLKTLEEPSSGTHILLISHQSNLLPATIRSRCQLVNFAIPQFSQALDWLAAQLKAQQSAQLLLQLAGGAPLLALQYVMQMDYAQQYENFINGLIYIADNKHDPVSAVTPWIKHPPQILLNWMSILLCDFIRVHSGLYKENLLNTLLYETIYSLTRKINILALFQLLDKLNQTVQYLHEKINLNSVLLLENLFCEWYFVFNKGNLNVEYTNP